MSISPGRRAVLHLRAADPKLARVIEQVGRCRFRVNAQRSHFCALCRAIVYQQLSGKAAATIYGRFEELHGGRTPSPEELLCTPGDRLRAAGLSRQKLGYLRDLASKVASREVALDSIDFLADEEVIETLVQVHGIGRWTAQMFLIFQLGRQDVLPELDLGIQKAIQRAYRLRSLPRPRDVVRIGAPWRPYATVASWYLWSSLAQVDGP
ncbi:MAG: DNA-3-methyladenine glycosylase 2 family protein [Deltaproteobacteria bacterium]|nr:DNA-3-methyladenine glycosylase 2 family protein [Deltaproteobacteria bacterium]